MKDLQNSDIPTGSHPVGLPFSSSRHAGIKLAFAGGLAAAALAVGGCGSAGTASNPSATTVASASAQTALASTGHAPAAKVHARVRVVHAHSAALKKSTGSHAQQRYLPPKITRGHQIQRPAPGTGGNAVNDDNPTGKPSRADSGRPTTAGQANPCVLVSRAQAQAFSGHAIKAVTEAPLGPTCIYQLVGSKREVTVAVEMAAFAAMKSHTKTGSHLTISGRAAVCARYNGSAVTYVALPGKRVLAVSAPCSVGSRFGVAALARLGY